MRFVKTILFSAVVSILLSFLCAPRVSAESPVQFSVSPAVITIPLTPGKTHTYPFVVTNTSAIPLLISAQFEQVTLDEEDGPLFINKEAGINTWSSVSPSQILLAPSEQKTVSLSVAIPKKVRFGGYVSMLFFDTISQKNNSFDVKSRIGALLLADIQGSGAEKTADLLELKPESFFVFSPSAPLSFRIKNTSLSHLSVKPIMRIKPLFGSMQTTLLDEKLIFPGRTRFWKTDVHFTGRQFLYRINVTAALGNGVQVSDETYVFVCPSLPVIISFTVVAFIAILIQKRKRVYKAFVALFD